MTDFRDLPDLACEAVGGVAIACSDEFYGEKGNLVRAVSPGSRDDAGSKRVRDVDGWMTRRYRSSDGVAPGPGSDVHDWCVVRLGVPGAIAGIVIDTALIRDNHPESAAVHGATIQSPLDLTDLDAATWVPLVPRSPIAGHTANLFPVASDQRFTHVRLALYPDGGVARLRIHGRPVPNRDRLGAGIVDLAALENGAFIEACSEGVARNLIMPGLAHSMADGWETRRRRGSGNDWAIISLAASGTIQRLEIDTSHFKGNAPVRVVVEGTMDSCSARDEAVRLSPDRTSWRRLLATPVQPHTRHVFDSELRRIGDIAFLRLAIFPCGGVARLRAWGTVAQAVDPGLVKLNAMTPLDATTALLRCSRSSAWAAAMTGARPFENVHALVRIAERIWWSLDERDYLEAFAGHPRIGELRANSPSGPLFTAEPEPSAEITRAALIEANKAYEAKHGFVFIVCASGRTTDALLAELLARFERSRPDELRTAAEEQAKIIRLRLVRLLQELV